MKVQYKITQYLVYEFLTLPNVLSLNFDFYFRFLMKNPWATGVAYDNDKAEKLYNGGNQIWYSFKDAIIDHLSCHPTRNAGQCHLKAKLFRSQQERENKQRLSTNMNVVSAGLQVIKMKAAALQFESMIALLSLCGSEVGNIGHGRYI